MPPQTKARKAKRKLMLLKQSWAKNLRKPSKKLTILVIQLVSRIFFSFVISYSWSQLFFPIIVEAELCALVDTYGPLVVRVCSDAIAARTAFDSDDASEAAKKAPFGHDTTLRSAAVLTLCKLMLVSETYCEAQLKLLFTLLEREVSFLLFYCFFYYFLPNNTTKFFFYCQPTESIRTNIIVCLGDLIARHPNAIDPWISRIFACLEDKVVSVRKHALMVLTHLILNDQIKARTQIVRHSFLVYYVCIWCGTNLLALDR